jgi:Superfamily I DNA and RNA helicases
MNYENELNKNQYNAVTSDAQFLRIIAGAGSGKTRVLTYRIAYLIEKNKVDPYNILAITFTNKVAKEMKTRTIALLPDYNLKQLSINTYHSWCARFLREEIHVLGFPRTFIIMDEDDSLSLVKSCGEYFGLKRTDDRCKKAFEFIKNQKCYGRLPSECDGKIHGHDDEIKFFYEYEKRKNEMFQLDFDDLIIYTIRILETNPEIKEKWTRRYKDILIDEFQDTNDLQFKLLTLITDSSSNVYVVGDPDQTIYTWRGANQKIILDFDKIYRPTTTITLDENYRSTPNILTVSNALISHNKDRFEKNLYTEQKSGSAVVLKAFSRSIDESNFIANKIEELRFQNKSLKYKDFAVLYRSSYLTQKLENVLVAKHIPYRVYGSLKFYSRAEVKDCLAYFKILMDENDDISFERIINVPRRKIGDHSVSVLKVEANSAHMSMIKYLKEIHKHDTALKSTVLSSLEDLFKSMEKTRQRLIENFEAYSEVLNEFLKEIGYYDYLESDDETKDKIDNVKALIDDVRSYLKSNPESNFVEYLQNVSLFSAQDDITDSDTVSLMTAHTAKGLEFDYVFVMCLAEGVFPNGRALLENPKAIEEERRLAYVACTRAKKQLFLSYNSDYSHAMGSYPLPSQFIEEMGLKAEVHSFNPYFNTSENEGKLYRYDFDKSIHHEDNKNVNIIDLTKRNNIKWNVGDIAIHQVFGEGKVIKVEDDIIEVDFKDFGKKTLLGNHPKLSKKEGGN